ncbi:hypothetical protein [Kineosporia babensis]|uniref:Uncharacterized protein n=1 Tax=Kineosporia babensis TaxID=499548 RepID=A0A9X1NAI9_9ACTN|nr:hypothetical protein [Kineosporia babensis]MCD5309468.1 hypothetical protein [Kineosporia babensis]
MHTYGSALALIGVTVPDHFQAEADVPVLTAPQAQGDLLIVPVAPEGERPWTALPDEGEQVVHGEATGNTHWLHRGFDSPGVRWVRADGEDPLVVGFVEVPPGQSAMLVHTDEHGANGIGPGTYAIRRKREFARPEPQLATNPLLRGFGRRPDANAWDLVWD